MIKTEEVIRECISKGIFEKRAIAKVMSESTGKSLEQSRGMIRRILGSAGRPVPSVHLDLYNDYMNAKNKDNHYVLASKKELKSSKVYIVTSAMNGTPVHSRFWNNLLKYVAFREAELHVVAMRYKNPNSIFTDNNEDVWVSEVLPYLDANNHELFEHVQLLSQIKISPTAALPLSNLNGFTGSKSCIVGHTRSHMLCMPVTPSSPHKFMMTTGSCTEANYTDSKAGRVGEHHHVLGFVIVTENDMHQVVANSDGSFIDYEWKVDGDISTAPPVKALILGDIHHSKLGKYEMGRIVNRIQGTRTPVVVCHDVFDATSVSPHIEKNPIEKVKRHEKGLDSLADELDEALDFLRTLKSYCEEVVLVASNHDDMLTRYVSSMQWQHDTNNAVKYAELLPIALREENVFAYLASQVGVKCLTLNDSYKICGIELAIHGHLGAAGSRGSIGQFKALSTKMIVGHSHSAAAIDGVYVVGTQMLDHGYNKGLSNWCVADCIINDDGKRQFIFK